jgi:hypothetical protein
MFQGWDGLGDCAHFLSSCLTAGGIRDLRTDWVPFVNSFLRNLSFSKTVGSEIPADRAKRIVDKGVMKKGDVILYIAPPGGELGGRLRAQRDLRVRFDYLLSYEISL